MPTQITYILGKNCKLFAGASYANATEQSRVIECDVTVATDTVDASDRGSGTLTVDVPVRKTGTASVKIRGNTTDHAFIDSLVEAIENGTPIWMNPSTPVQEMPGWWTVSSVTSNLGLNDVVTVDAELSMLEYCPSETNLPYEVGNGGEEETE